MRVRNQPAQVPAEKKKGCKSRTWTLRCGQPRTKVTQCLERITLFTLSPSTASMCSIAHQGLTRPICFSSAELEYL